MPEYDLQNTEELFCIGKTLHLRRNWENKCIFTINCFIHTMFFHRNIEF